MSTKGRQKELLIIVHSEEVRLLLLFSELTPITQTGGIFAYMMPSFALRMIEREEMGRPTYYIAGVGQATYYKAGWGEQTPVSNFLRRCFPRPILHAHEAPTILWRPLR